MNQDLQNKLFLEFPSFFADKDKGPMETCMCWGIECGDGWFDILYEMCLEIRDANPSEDFKFTQIKEKFGTLRIYEQGATEEVYNIITKAEDKSASTCEDCGSKEATTRGKYWVSTLCNSCRDKQEKK
jgi:hypothetical protein